MNCMYHNPIRTSLYGYVISHNSCNKKSYYHKIKCLNSISSEWIFTGNERKRCPADDWKWEAYGCPREVSTRNVWAHEDLLDIQVSGTLSLSHLSALAGAAAAIFIVIIACYFHVFQGKWKAWIYGCWAKTSRVLLRHCTVIAHLDVMRLCKLVADNKNVLLVIHIGWRWMIWDKCCKM